MRGLDHHLESSNPRSRRASLGHVMGNSRFSSAQSVPAQVNHGSRQQRRSSLGQNLHAAFVGNAACQSPAKQARRASLGQMLNSVKKSLTTRDDTATCISEEDSCASSYGFSMESSQSNDTSARVLLHEVKQLVKHHSSRKREMEASIASDLELAKARLAAGSQLGAVLSMRRVHRNTSMLAYVSATRDQYSQIRDSLETSAVSASEVETYRKAIRETTEKLLKADAPTPTDAFLLHQLESQMEEIGV